jgi:hypothetical protein
MSVFRLVKKGSGEVVETASVRCIGGYAWVHQDECIDASNVERVELVGDEVENVAQVVVPTDVPPKSEPGPHGSQRIPDGSEVSGG